MRLTKNFTLAELCVTTKALDNTPDAESKEWLADLAGFILQPLRDHVGVPVNVSSGYRSEAVNRAAGGAKRSQHRFGQAADFVVAGISPREVCETIIALKLPFDQLIQEHGRWVHVSISLHPRRQVLTATRNKAGKVTYLAGLV